MYFPQLETAVFILEPTLISAVPSFKRSFQGYYEMWDIAKHSELETKKPDQVFPTSLVFYVLILLLRYPFLKKLLKFWFGHCLTKIATNLDFYTRARAHAHTRARTYVCNKRNFLKLKFCNYFTFGVKEWFKC